jgi:hypothetical protein
MRRKLCVIIGFLVILLAGFCLTQEAQAQTAIYYSVGTDSTALYSGNASASSGTLTLIGGSAVDKIGVGDEIREGSNRHYITQRNSSTEFLIQNSAANGGVPGDTAITFTETPITIYRAFSTGGSSLETAEANSGDSSHLNTYNLSAAGGNYQLNWACYADGEMNYVGSDQEIVIIDGYTTRSRHLPAPYRRAL